MGRLDERGWLEEVARWLNSKASRWDRTQKATTREWPTRRERASRREKAVREVRCD